MAHTETKRVWQRVQQGLTGVPWSLSKRENKLVEFETRAQFETETPFSESFSLVQTGGKEKCEWGFVSFVEVAVDPGRPLRLPDR